jgi:predicted nucleotidyltransferase
VVIDKDRSRKFGFEEFMDIYLLLQQQFGENIDYSTREGSHPVLRPEIEREAVRVF